MDSLDGPKESRVLGRYPSIGEHLDGVSQENVDKVEHANGLRPEVVANGVSIEKNGEKI